MGISFWQIAIVVVLVVLLFGRGKISSLMGDVAKGIKSFKKGMSDDTSTNNQNDNSEYHYHERTYGSFNRSFKLLIIVVEENISATFRNGILTVVLPKNEEAQPKQRTIKIK